MDTSRALLAQPAQEVQERWPLPAAAPGAPRGGEEPFPTANTAGGSGAAGRATHACRSRNRQGRFGRGSDPWVRICQRQGRDQRAKAPAPAGAVGSDTPALAGSQATGTWLGSLPRAGRECREEDGMLVAMPIPDGDRHHASAQWLRCLPRAPGGAGRGGRRPTWRIPPAPFFPGWKPGPSDA